MLYAIFQYGVVHLKEQTLGQQKTSRTLPKTVGIDIKANLWFKDVLFLVQHDFGLAISKVYFQTFFLSRHQEEC
jgi:hypothetical protein